MLNGGTGSKVRMSYSCFYFLCFYVSNPAVLMLISLTSSNPCMPSLSLSLPHPSCTSFTVNVLSFIVRITRYHLSHSQPLWTPSVLQHCCCFSISLFHLFYISLHHRLYLSFPFALTLSLKKGLDPKRHKFLFSRDDA